MKSLTPTELKEKIDNGEKFIVDMYVIGVVHVE